MKAFKYKLRPSPRVARLFELWLDLCRELHNAALEERIKAYRMNGVSLSYAVQCAELPEVKAGRPDVAAVNAQVPFVDVVSTMSDPSLPLTITEWEEWGDPRAEPYASYIASYSPYDNVVATAYPALYVTAGLNDPRVSYHEPAKWVAKLRSLRTDDRLMVLKTEMGAGHGGPSGRYDAWREEAQALAFLCSIV